MPMKLDTHLILPNFFLSNDSRTLTLTLSGKSIQGKSLEEKGEIDASKVFTKDNQDCLLHVAPQSSSQIMFGVSC